MKEKSVGAVIFRDSGEPKFLLLLHRYRTEYYDFCKGNVEEGEGEKETIEREIQEETGITDVKFVPGFRERITYSYKRLEGGMVNKEVIFYLVETSEEEVKLSSEHYGYKWLGYYEALRITPFKNSKDVLKRAKAFLGRLGGQKSLGDY